MTFQRGFRNPIGAIGGIAGADAIAVSLFPGKLESDKEHVFTLANPANQWRFYRLDYAISYSAEGHATTGPHQQQIVVKLLDDPELLSDAWRVELSLALAATEVGNIAIADTGFDVEGGIAFPVGVDAKILTKPTVAIGDGWSTGSFNAWSARVHITVLAREVSP